LAIRRAATTKRNWQNRSARARTARRNSQSLIASACRRYHAGCLRNSASVQSRAFPPAGSECTPVW
jgi:hypothetical protein